MNCKEVDQKQKHNKIFNSQKQIQMEQNLLNGRAHANKKTITVNRQLQKTTFN